MKIFKAELSTSSLDALVKKLENYPKELENSLISINQEIANRVYELVMVKVPHANSTGDLMSSIKKEVTKEFARVYTDNPHAAFAEYGIGVIGAENPHPEASVQGWQYDVNKHGRKGWYYNKGTRENPDIYWTAGYAGVQYMYKTYIDIQPELEPLVDKVLKQRGLI